MAPASTAERARPRSGKFAANKGTSPRHSPAKVILATELFQYISVDFAAAASCISRGLYMSTPCSSAGIENWTGA
jgi:hypothetical protein